MIGKPGKTCGAFLPFAASSLQRMRGKQLAVSILVNAPPLPSSSVDHQKVTFGRQVARLTSPPPHPTPTHTRGLSSVATCNVVHDPRDLSSVAIYQVRSTRNVNIPPHPTPPHPTPTHTRGLSSVATCNVVNDPRDLSSVAIYQVRSTRNVNIPPTPPHPNPH